MSSDPIVDTAPGILAGPAGTLNPAPLELESITRRLLRGSGVSTPGAKAADGTTL